MGAQIAAMLADMGIDVHLLDLKTTDQGHPSQRAIMAIKGLTKMKPPPLMSEQSARRITPGNFTDDMSCVAQCDWVIEAVTEDLAIKKSIHAQIAKYKKPHVPVSTNTSGIPLRQISEDFSQEYLDTFMAVHFFNPPRYMKLVEVISGGREGELFSEVSSWCLNQLGKDVVYAYDTINFVANRIGVFSLCSIIHHAQELGLNPETVDSLTGKLMGRPSSATYRTMDVVGLDTAAAVAMNVFRQVPDDPYHSYYQLPGWVNQLIEKGCCGQKSGHRGVYEKSKDAHGKTQIKSYDAQTDAYVMPAPATFPWMAEAAQIPDVVKRLDFVISHDDAGAQLVWRALKDVFSYAALLLVEIAGSHCSNVDQAMTSGFNWEIGVFKLWQGLGVNKITQRMLADGAPLPEWLTQKLATEPDFGFFKPDPFTVAWQLAPVMGRQLMEWSPDQDEYVPMISVNVDRVPLLNHSGKDVDPRTLAVNDAATLLQLGAREYLLNFHTKMNAINADLLSMIQQSVVMAVEQADVLILANHGKAFSAGADLQMLLQLIRHNKFAEIDQMLQDFQSSMQLLKYSPVVTIAASHGLALGGGCEVTLHTDLRHIYAESYVGLVEAGVGLIPAAGGTKELALRCYKLAAKYQADPMIFLKPIFELVAMAKVSTSAAHAIELGYYEEHTTTIAFDRRGQIEAARALGLAASGRRYSPPQQAAGVQVAGEPGFETFKMMIYNMLEGKMISAHDALVAEKLAFVLCGGDLPQHTKVDEAWFLDLERKVFIELCQEQKTEDRVAYMLKHGKPLRN